MRVTDLLQLETLELELRWGDDALLDRDIGGVTVTDLEDPARFVRPGDAVLSGLVWWTPKQGLGKAERFVAALRASGAVALLAGEETHGLVPDAVVDACRDHGLPLLAVPAGVDFRAITDAVYLRLWGRLDVSDGHALPANVHRELDRLLAESAPLAMLLDHACGPFAELACYVVTATGRTLAQTAAASAVPRHKMAGHLRRSPETALRVDAETSPYDAWYLHLPTATETPPRVLQEISGFVARYHRALVRRQDEHRQAADRLVTTITAPDDDRLPAALADCGLSDVGPYLVVSLTLAAGDAVAALGEAVGDFPGAIGGLPHGEAVAVLAPKSCTDARAQLAAAWPDLHACAPDVPLHAGVSAPALSPDDLRRGLDQARHAASAARSAAPRGARITAAEELTTLAAVLSGLPEGVRAAYRAQVLGPLLHYSASAPTILLDTLETFLDHNGSWTRTAETLHVHVNTVHYRIQRVEQLTGRDLGRLDHRLDLRTALLCR